MDMKTYISGIPSGGIVLWSGGFADVPSGFVICDGNNSTPDLRDRFVVGAGSTFSLDSTGGASTHMHGFLAGGHSHSVIPDGGALSFTAGPIFPATNVAFTGGTTNPGSGLPPYYALCYIMKT